MGDHPAGHALPWMSRDDCLEVISAKGLKDTIPAFCLSGDPDCPASHDILFLDCDYKLHLDSDGLGALVRDRVSAGMVSAGAGVFGSTSGNGWHIVCRLTLEDILNGKCHYAGLPTKDTIEGPQDTGRTTGSGSKSSRRGPDGTSSGTSTGNWPAPTTRPPWAGSGCETWR